MHDLSYLRTTLFYFAGIAAVVVFIVLIYALTHFKRSDEEGSDNKQSPNLKVELLWTVVPFVLLFLMALPVIKSYFFNHSVVKIQHKKLRDNYESNN